MTLKAGSGAAWFHLWLVDEEVREVAHVRSAQDCGWTHLRL